MADLSDINSALQTKITGQDSSGLETNPVNATTLGLQVDVQASVLPTGASTSANQTTEITALQLIDNPVGSVGAGTAGSSSYLIGLVFNTALPTLTNGQQAALQGDSSGRLIIAPLTSTSVVTAVGNVASGASDSGNPLKIGAVYNSTQPTVTTGQRVDLQATARGALKTNLQDSAGSEYTTSNRFPVDANFTVLGGQLVPTITNKLRVRYSTTPATAGSAYSTIYTRTGTGLFFGFQADFNSANVRLRLTIDGGQIFEITMADIKLFQFNDTSTTRMQMGGFWATVGNTVDFSTKYAIPYTSSITIEMQRSDGTNHQMNQYMVLLTEDT